MRAPTKVSKTVRALMSSAAFMPILTAPAMSQQLEEIIVTARKQAERLQDVPITITALTGTDIANSGIEGLRDYAAGLPGVFVIDRGPGQQQLAMRGIVDPTNPAQPENRETVSLYLDETPVGANGYNPDIKLFDIARIEALRGPQGTLYGAGAMSGTIRVITNPVDLTKISGAGGGEVSSTAHGGANYAANGMLNVPVVSDRFGLRGVAYYRKFDGYIDNVRTGATNTNEESTKGGRLAARLDPADGTSFVASAVIQNLDYADSGQADNRLGLNSYSHDRGTPEAYHDKFRVYNLTARHSFGNSEILSSTSYQDRSYTSSQDISAALRLFFGKYLPTPLANTSRIKDFTQELRYSVENVGGFKGTVGGFYQWTRRGFDQTAPSPGFTAATGIPTTLFGSLDNLFESTETIKTRQYALFGELGYDITDRLTATAGLRWFKVTTSEVNASKGLINGGPTAFTGRLPEDGVNPRFELSYRVTGDALLYASAARGFRLGGVNGYVPVSFCAADLARIGLTKAPEGFGSDHLWNYELGAKTRWLDDRLIVNAAAYYIDWGNIQSTRSLTCGFPFRENSGKATVKGVELEIAVKPVPQLQLSLRTSYTDATLAQDSVNLGGRSGDRVPYVPKYNLSTTARYTVPLSDALDGFLQGDYMFVDKSYNAYNAATALKQPARRQFDLRVGVIRGPWEVAVFAENLTDSVQVLRYANFQGTFVSDIGRPRTVGIRLRRAAD
jgi:outer membrane receptor protein involved in Fe transport